MREPLLHFCGWVPEAYCDETSPKPRATPDAWLRLGEVVMLAPADDTETEPPLVLADGETVRFLSLTGYPSLTLHLSGGGRHGGGLRIDGTVPAIDGLSLCLRGEPDSLSDTIVELVNYCRAETLSDGAYEVLIYRWCDGQPFVLRDGRFLPGGAA